MKPEEKVIHYIRKGLQEKHGAEYDMLSPEQKAELFAAIPAERLEMPTLQPVHQEYLIELKTSAGNPYLLLPKGDIKCQLQTFWKEMHDSTEARPAWWRSTLPRNGTRPLPGGISI